MSIEDYEFKDEDVRLREYDEISVSLNVTIENNNFDYIILEIDDVIAMAKHFNLTANDIL